jgi:hypothetical protein
VVQTNKKSIGLLVIILLCLVLISGCKCLSGDDASCSFKDEKPARAMGEAISVTATVEQINYDTRIVTIKGPQGRTVSLKVTDEAYNFDQVKAGDLVDIVYSTSVVILLEEAVDGTVPSHVKQSGMLRAPKGQKPEGVMIDTMDVTAIVEDIDYENRTVDLKGTYGNIISVEVDEKVENFKNIKKGDLVKARYTEALAISVRPAD